MTCNSASENSSSLNSRFGVILIPWPLNSNAINSDDVSSISKKAKQIVEIAKPIIQGQEIQLKKENEHSIKTLENASFYKYLAFAQIAITVFIGLIQVYNFKRFLKSQHVI